jgi:protocadherin Fat 1/2/3
MVQCACVEVSNILLYHQQSILNSLYISIFPSLFLFYICTLKGYHGKFCEIDVDECENNPCLNGATCLNEAGSFRCICPPELKSCGDPLYSSFSISNLINNASLEIRILALTAFLVIIGLVICLCFYCCCCRSRRGGGKSREDGTSIKNNEASPISAVDYKRVSKMSNLEAVQHQQRPTSYSTAAPDNLHNVPYNPIMQYTNNLDTLRNYGTAGDELESNLPSEYRKLNRNPMSQQMVNINNSQSLVNATTVSDPTDTSAHKQNKWDQIHLQTFSDKTKINNDKRLSPHHHHHHHYQSQSQQYNSKQGVGVLQGRLLPSPAATYAGTTESGAYDWDVSDWKPRSLNVLSNITEVPGSEVVDSSSFHSNESNESHTLRTNNIVVVGGGHLQSSNIMSESMGSSIDPCRDMGTLNENIELEFPDEDPLTINFDHQSMSYLNHLDSGSDGDYRFNTG